MIRNTITIWKRSAFARLAATAVVALGLATYALADGSYSCCDSQACGGSCQSSSYTCGGSLSCGCSCDSYSSDCGYSGCSPNCTCIM